MMAAHKSRAPKITETQEHKTIADWFRKCGLRDGAVAFHIRNERSTGKITAHRMGMLPGVPDWCIVHAGRVGFIELKQRGFRAKKLLTGKLNLREMRQIDVQNVLKGAGAWVEICETLGEVVAVLRYHGVPVRASDVVTEGLREKLPKAMAQAALAAACMGLPRDTLDEMIDEAADV